MKKTFLSLVLVAASLVASAATVLHPYQEVNYRTNNNDPTSWSVLKVASESAQFEVKWSARFFAVQQWAIPGISKANQLDIYYTRVAGQTNDGAVSAWPFPYEVLTENTFSKEEGSFLDHVKTIFGAYPGDGNTIPNAPLAKAVTATDSASNHARVLTFDATAITALKSAGRISNDTLYVNLLLTTDRADNDLNYKYYSIGSTEKVNYMIVTGTQVSYAVDNISQGKGYTTIAAAVAAAAENDTLVINENVEISSRLETNVPLTIIGKTGDEKVLRATGLNAITILPKKAITLKDLIIDGQNVDRNHPAIEASNALVTLDNVTVQNFKRTADGQVQGIIAIKSNGSAWMKNASLVDNAVPAGYGDIFLGNQKHLYLEGNNVISNGIFIEKNDSIEDKGTTHTTPIDIRVPETRTVGDATPLVANCTDVTKYNLVAANPDWEIAAGETYLYIKDNGSAAKLNNTAVKSQTMKVIRNGQLYIRKGAALYNVLGLQY